MAGEGFGAADGAWHDFYMLLGGAAATLLGLLFVAVLLNLRLFADPTRPKLRASAVATFTAFLYLVLIALTMVPPDATPASVAWPLLLLSLAELWGTQREAGHARRLLGSGLRGYLLEALPTLCYAAVIVFAVVALLGYPDILTEGWMIPVMATLLGTATGTAWDLLLQAGVAESTPDQRGG